MKEDEVILGVSVMYGAPGLHDEAVPEAGSPAWWWGCLLCSPRGVPARPSDSEVASMSPPPLPVGHSTVSFSFSIFLTSFKFCNKNVGKIIHSHGLTFNRSFQAFYKLE